MSDKPYFGVGNSKSKYQFLSKTKIEKFNEMQEAEEKEEMRLRKERFDQKQLELKAEKKEKEKLQLEAEVATIKQMLRGIPDDE